MILEILIPLKKKKEIINDYIHTYPKDHLKILIIINLWLKRENKKRFVKKLISKLLKFYGS